MKTAFEMAVDAAGGLVALAQLLDKPKQTVNHYRKRFPEDVCPAVERATGVPVEVLRPDLQWIRIPDADWPKGKPLLDVEQKRPIQAHQPDANTDRRESDALAVMAPALIGNSGDANDRTPKVER